MFLSPALPGSFALDTSLAVNRSLLTTELSWLEAKLSKFGREFLLLYLASPSTCLLNLPTFTFWFALLSSVASLLVFSGKSFIAGFSFGKSVDEWSGLSGIMACGRLALLWRRRGWPTLPLDKLVLLGPLAELVLGEQSLLSESVKFISAMEWRREGYRAAGVEQVGDRFPLTSDSLLLKTALPSFTPAETWTLDGLNCRGSSCSTVSFWRERWWKGLKDLRSITSGVCNGPINFGCILLRSSFSSELSSSRLLTSLRVPKILRSSSSCLLKDIISWSIFPSCSFLAVFILVIWSFNFLSSFALVCSTCPISEFHLGSIFKLNMTWRIREQVITRLRTKLTSYAMDELLSLELKQFNFKEGCLWEFNNGRTTKNVFMIADWW